MQPISIYIHWPFCLSLCPYCDFNSHLFSELEHKKWNQSYQKEIEYFTSKLKGRKVKSIFFGGGTPSLMHPETINSVLKKIADIAVISKDTEITLEANPTSYEAEKFKAFKSAGINRVSIGIQSFKEKSLKLLGRKHSAEEAINAIKSASKIFDRYSFDLIYAIPQQTIAEWKEEARFAISLARDHISLYQLTIEKGTPFYKLFHDGDLLLPSNDIAAEMYEWTNNELEQNGYQRYEISNYAKPGQECLHNLCYWQYDEYIGIGPGAHSRLHEEQEISALMMTHKPKSWLDAVEAQGHGIQKRNKLSLQETIEETLMMGTRLTAGISEDKFTKITGKRFQNILNPEITKLYTEQDLIKIENGYLRLTPKGLMLHNYLVPRILA